MPDKQKGQINPKERIELKTKQDKPKKNGVVKKYENMTEESLGQRPSFA